MNTMHDHAWQCRDCGQVSDHALTTPNCEHRLGLKRIALPKEEEPRIRRCIP